MAKAPPRTWSHRSFVCICGFQILTTDCRCMLPRDSWADGAHYTGAIKKGRRQGIGVICLTSCEPRMHCSLVSLNSSAACQYYQSHRGDVYHGMFVDDEFHGKGLMKYNNGARYEGGMSDSTVNASRAVGLPVTKRST